MNQLTEFGIECRVYRSRANMSLKQMAILAGFTDQYVSMVERGSKDPSDDYVAGVIRALKLPPVKAAKLRDIAATVRNTHRIELKDASPMLRKTVANFVRCVNQQTIDDVKAMDINALLMKCARHQ